MKHTLAVSLFFTAYSLFGAQHDHYVARKQRDTFAGAILPCTLIRNQQNQFEPYFLLGKESYPENGMIVWSDFGGSNEVFDISPQHVALRELAEETAKIFCDDTLFNPHRTVKEEVEKNIAQCEKTLRMRSYISRTLDNGKKVYTAVAKVPYVTPHDILTNANNAQEEKYREMTHFMWVKAYPFLKTIANTIAKNKQNSKEIIAPTIMVTNELNQQQKIAIRATFFLRIRPEQYRAKIKAIVDQYVQNPY